MALTDLTAAQVQCLRDCADFQNVIKVYKDGGWKADTDENIKAIALHWFSQDSFIKTYQTAENYLGDGQCKCGQGSTSPNPNPKSPGTQNAGLWIPKLDVVVAWAKDNPIPAAVVGFTLYTMLFGSGRR